MVKPKSSKSKRKSKSLLPPERKEEFIKQVYKGQSDIMLRDTFKLSKDELRKLEQDLNLKVNWVSRLEMANSSFYRDTEFNIRFDGRKQGSK